MVANSLNDTQLIREQPVKNRLVSLIVGLFSAFFGMSLILGIFNEQLPPASSKEGMAIGFVVWILLIIISIMTLARNIIIKFIFNKVARSTFWSMLTYGRIINCAIAVACLLLFIIGIFNTTFLATSFVLFFLYAPWVLIFSDPLTDEAKIIIPFELLFSSLNQFIQRQRWLKIVVKKFADTLKEGNIKIPSSDLLFYFNSELLKSTNIADKLRNIEAWLLGKEILHFETFCDVKDKFEIYRKHVFLKKTLTNPTVLKVIIVLVVLVITFGTHPEIIKDLFPYLF